MPGRLYVLRESVNFGAMTQSAAAAPVVGTVWSMAMVEQPSGVLQSFFNFNKCKFFCKFIYNIVLFSPTPSLSLS